MNALDRFIADRDAALYSLDREKIEKFLFDHYLMKEDEYVPDQIFWGGVYKAILATRCPPPEIAQKAKDWFIQNGYTLPAKTKKTTNRGFSIG